MYLKEFVVFELNKSLIFLTDDCLRDYKGESTYGIDIFFKYSGW